MLRLSPFTHYYVQKLLREQIDRSNCLRGKGMSSSTNHQLDLYQALGNLYPSPIEQASKIKELEFLTTFCQEIEQDKFQRESVKQIKQQIFQLLGFHFITLLSEQLPTILSEESAYRFCVYQAHRVQECVRCHNEYYGLAHQFQKADRLQAYQFAWALAKKGIPLILTVSPLRYVIWVSLRSPTYALLPKQSKWLLKMVLPMYSVLSKFKQVGRSNLPPSIEKSNSPTPPFKLNSFSTMKVAL